MTPATEQRIRATLAYEGDRTAPPPDFPALPEIPGGRYTSEAFHALEQEHVFRKTWQVVGRVEDFPTPGSFQVWRKLGPPILVVRGKDEVVRAFYNTCRHRGAAVVPDDSGRVNVLRCQYHSWAYDLTGRLINTPDERDFCGLVKSTRNLIPVRCETWGGWIFVNLDDDAPSFADSMGPLADEWACMDMAALRVVHRRSTIIDCNWKAACDAFQEVYHITTIHKDKIGTALNPKQTAIASFLRACRC